MTDIATFILGVCAGTALGVFIAETLRSAGTPTNLNELGYKVIEWDRLGHYLTIQQDGIQYRGSGNVWRRLDSGRRCNPRTEELLADVYAREYRRKEATDASRS